MKIVRWGFMEIFLDFIPLTNTFQKFRAKFPHSPIHHYTSIYGALFFSVSPVRCTCIIKYGAVRKFFQIPHEAILFRTNWLLYHRLHLWAAVCDEAKIKAINFLNCSRFWVRERWAKTKKPVWIWMNQEADQKFILSSISLQHYLRYIFGDRQVCFLWLTKNIWHHPSTVTQKR